MTSRNISKKYFIGKSRNNGKWASVYTYKPNSDELRDTRGLIFATISLVGPKTFATATAGNMLLDYFHEVYFEHPANKTLDALEKSVLSTSKHLQLLMKHDEKVKEGVEMDLNAMVIKGDIAYFVNMGGGHIFIYRDGELTNLSENLKDPIGTGLIKLGSMVIKPADVFVVGTPQLTHEISEKELQDAVVDFNETKLKQKLYDDDSSLALMLVGVDVDRKENKAELGIREKIKSELENKLDNISNESAELDGEKTLADVIEEGKASESAVSSVNDGDAIENLKTKLEDDLDEDELAEENDYELEEGPSIGDRLGEGFSKIKVGVTDFINKRKQSSTGVMPSREDAIKDRAVQQHTPGIDSDAEKATYLVLLERAKTLLVKIGKGVKVTVWNNLLGMGEDDVYVIGSDQRKKRNIRFIVVLVIVVLGILYFSITNIQQSVEQKETNRAAEASLELAEELILDVEQIAPIKAKASSSDLGKQELYDKLNEAEVELAKVTGDEFSEKATGLQEQIEELRDILNRTIAVTDPRELVDFGSSFPGANTVDMTVGNGKIYVADKQYGKVYQIDYSGSVPTILAEGLNQPKTITIDDNGDIVFIDEDGDKRMGTINGNDGNIIRHSGTSEFRVGNISAIEFSDIFGGRVYGIDQSQNKVIVLQRSGDAYGIPQNRFELAELSTAPDLHIMDLKIYVLADINQGLYRFFNEQDDSPQISGLESGENLFNATALYIDGLYIYIADPENQRILVFTKAAAQIELVAQYKYRGEDSDGFKNIKEIHADREAGKLFVLDGTKVIELDLTSLNSI